MFAADGFRHVFEELHGKNRISRAHTQSRCEELTLAGRSASPMLPVIRGTRNKPERKTEQTAHFPTLTSFNTSFTHMQYLLNPFSCRFLAYLAGYLAVSVFTPPSLRYMRCEQEFPELSFTGSSEKLRADWPQSPRVANHKRGCLDTASTN